MTTRVSPLFLPSLVSRRTVHSSRGIDADGADFRSSYYSHVLPLTLILRGPDVLVGLRLIRAYQVVYI